MNNIEAQKRSDSYPFAITFIDPLFAIALHLGFSDGLFAEQWFREWRRPAGEEPFAIAVFALGFLAIILAWLNYHRSVSLRPLRGLARFTIDVVLVMIYAAILIKCANFAAVLLLLAITYLLYVFWDLAKILEYEQDDAANLPLFKRFGGFFVDLFWFIVFAALVFVFKKNLLSPNLALALAFIAAIGHRINKVIAIWSSLGGAIKGLLFSPGKTSP